MIYGKSCGDMILIYCSTFGLRFRYPRELGLCPRFESHILHNKKASYGCLLLYMRFARTNLISSTNKRACLTIKKLGRLSIINIGDYLYSTNDLPVISAGCFKPIRSSTVGATSAKIPSLTRATLSDTTTIGTGLSE